MIDAEPDDEVELMIDVRRDERSVCIFLSGALDLHGATKLSAALEALPDHPGQAGQAGAVAIDLAAVDFLDSAGLTALILAVRDHGARPVAPSPRVRRTLELAGATELLELR